MTLQMIQKTIKNNPTCEVSPNNRQVLAEFLSNCLIPDELKQDAHEDALKTYEIILDRQISLMNKRGQKLIFNEDLGLFYSGLFGYYQYAGNKQKKEQVLNIMQHKILRLKDELVICLPGFIMCLLHALDEASGEN
jgi:hypothetical protein